MGVRTHPGKNLLSGNLRDASDEINRRRPGCKEKEMIFGTRNVRTLSRSRWADVVQRDALQLLGIRGWRRRVENGDEWRGLMGEAKARKGL